MSGIARTDAMQPVLWQHRCKICQMAKTHPELFKELHFNVLEVGMSMNRAMSYLNSRIDNEGIPLVKINNQNMGAHFSAHITMPDRVQAELSKDLSGQATLKEIAPEAGTFVEDMIRRKIGNEVSDYLNLDQLRSQMMEKLEFLEEATTSVDKAGKKFVDLDAMSQYTSLIKEIRNTIVDLNKIRSSKQLMNVIIKSLVERSTFDIVQKLSREYDQVKKDMADAGVPDNVITRIDQQQRIRLAEVVATVARQAVEDTIKSYRLK